MANGYFERVEKRSPYEPERHEKPEKKKTNGTLAFFALVFLCVLFPVGLVLLLNRKIRWSGGAKVIAAVLGLMVFWRLFVYVSEVQTKKDWLMKVQPPMQTAVEWTREKVTKGYDIASEWVTKTAEDGKEKAITVWQGIRRPIAEKTHSLLETTGTNAKYLKQELPVKLIGRAIEPYKEIVDYRPTPAPTTAAESTPDPEPENVFENVPEFVDQTAFEVPDLPDVDEEQTALTLPPLDDKPEVRSASEAEVFYNDGGTYYHKKSTCKGMYTSDSHTLGEAWQSGKKPCANCDPISFDMLNREQNDYLWVDSNGYGHTSDLCFRFDRTKGYSIVLNEELYAGSYKYCTECKADVSYEYMRREHEGLTTGAVAADSDTLYLYEYEKSVEVYYRAGEAFYHADAACQNMGEEDRHNLYEALYAAALKPCPACGPATEGDCREKLMSGN